jgi:hypothetical protein
LIYIKVRGLSAKCQEIVFSRNYFADEKPMDQVQSSWTTGAFGSPWTDAMADLGSTSELGLRPLQSSRSPRKGWGRWRRRRRAHMWAHRSSGGGETAARWRGMAGGGRCSVRWGLRTQEQAKEGRSQCGDGRGCSSPFYRGREEYGGGSTGEETRVVNGGNDARL